MGLLSKLFTKNAFSFQPDFSKTEYDNWLDYLSQGGTTEKWKFLKKEHKWTFKPDPVEKHMKHEKEFRPLFPENQEHGPGLDAPGLFCRLDGQLPGALLPPGGAEVRRRAPVALLTCHTYKRK